MLGLLFVIIGCVATVVIYWRMFCILRRVQQKVVSLFEGGLSILQIHSAFRWLGLVNRFAEHWWSDHEPLCKGSCTWYFGPELRREYFERICYAKYQITFSYKPMLGVLGLITLTRIEDEEPYYKITALRMGHTGPIGEISSEALQMFLSQVLVEMELPVLIDLTVPSNLPKEVFLKLGFISTAHGLSWNTGEDLERWI